MMKSKKTALLTAGLTMLLSAAVIVGGTFAIFGTSKTREVTITTGSVDISAEFGDVTLYSLTPSSTVAQPTGSLSFNAGGTASLDSANGSIALTGIVPGDRAEFTLTVTNTGASAARYLIAYDATVTGVAGAEDALNYTVTAADEAVSFGSWSAEPLAAGESVTLNISVELDKSAEQVTDGNGAVQTFITQASVVFTIYAGQANASDADLNGALGFTPAP